ncbi:3-oxoacyl-ACP reductase FabG [Flavobacteriaceae bacterium F89]|uniref:3-oxoacyl-ACP reductase FabG n=1 Tax=Cerina litoralis TaxID=2874477 RepID=A0AAE3JPG5_9FLAO|nr:3-oxoacyl-ACP reductase family protein [Cerina litoralis]MCG2462090.1 3-oxoacyl-ACP reductase FabG [Cerina litoralis]
MDLNIELKNQVALVTGAAQGLGKAIAISLARRGASVIVNDISPYGAMDEVVGEIRGFGGTATSILADISDSKQVEILFSQLYAEYGRLDILVNNAGISRDQDIFATSLDDWKSLINVNLTSGFLCSKAALILMEKQRYGRIIFISSVVGQQGALYGHTHYAASKAGQLGLMKTLARTGANFGVTCNAIAPGIIETGLLSYIHGPKKIATMTDEIPLGLGQPSDIGETTAFLCGQGARYITGATIDVNGGLYIR